jgi:hypothetical protein
MNLVILMERGTGLTSKPDVCHLSNVKYPTWHLSWAKPKYANPGGMDHLISSARATGEQSLIELVFSREIVWENGCDSPFALGFPKQDRVLKAITLEKGSELHEFPIKSCRTTDNCTNCRRDRLFTMRANRKYEQ